MTNDIKEKLRKAVESIYKQGFKTAWDHSGQGFNGEYGCSKEEYNDMLEIELDHFMVGIDRVIDNIEGDNIGQ